MVVVVVPVFPPVEVVVVVGKGMSSAAIAKAESVYTTTKLIDFYAEAPFPKSEHWYLVRVGT